MERYKHSAEMGEISGFGGGYEAVCQAMLQAGCEWLERHPNADPQFHGFKNIYGIITEDNDDAKGLTKAVVGASGGDCTGAMHQAVISRVLWIKEHSWDEYVSELVKNRAEKKEQ